MRPLEIYCRSFKLKTHATFDASIRQADWIYQAACEGGIHGGLKPKPPNIAVLLKDQGLHSVGCRHQNTLEAGADTPAGVLPNEKCVQHKSKVKVWRKKDAITKTWEFLRHTSPTRTLSWKKTTSLEKIRWGTLWKNWIRHKIKCKTIIGLTLPTLSVIYQLLLPLT